MKRHPFRLAAFSLIGLYVVAIVITWFRKHALDGEMLFWMSMSVLLLSGFDVAQKK